MTGEAQSAFSRAPDLLMPFPVFRHKALRRAGLALLAAPLAGCDTVVMNPHGDIAVQQAHLIWQSVFLMLLIIVPVMVLIVVFAIRYRQSANATYTPDWDHSTRLELLIWGAPLLIIIALGTITWISTHKLDPYRPLDRIDAQRPITTPVKPLQVDVVAMDWKWLFIYPDYGIATVNELAAPVDTPIDFQITSSTVMNAFYVPALAGMIYAMPAMQTELHAVINEPGDYEGLSANYSGAGFSGMHFRFYGMAQKDFDGWIAKARAAGGSLDLQAYEQLRQPERDAPARSFASFEPDLYTRILDRCIDASQTCMSQAMSADAPSGDAMRDMPGMHGDHAASADAATPAAMQAAETR